MSLPKTKGVFVWASWQLSSPGSRKPKQIPSFQNQLWRTKKPSKARPAHEIAKERKMGFRKLPTKLHPLPPQSDPEGRNVFFFFLQPYSSVYIHPTPGLRHRHSCIHPFTGVRSSSIGHRQDQGRGWSGPPFIATEPGRGDAAPPTAPHRAHRQGLTVSYSARA
jgi:hypothetical protein